jgi:O-methyltransferase involved in polyketide biosynthesis
MKGNEKIAFTAEAVAFMRATKNVDEFSKYFVSEETRKRFRFFSKIVPRSNLERIFAKRINLSGELDNMVASYGPEQIVELACGYSTRGLILTRKNPKLVYIETDFSSVIERKKEIMKKNKIGLRKNHRLVAIDAIKDNLFDELKKIVDRKKRTLVVAETLTSYLNKEEHEFLVSNVQMFLENFKEGAYLSHEGKKMINGFFGKMLLFYRNVVGKTKSYRHFHDAGEVKKYFIKKGFKEVKVVENENISQMIYLAEK